MKYVVTGGAGFIGSCIVRTLNDLCVEGDDDGIIIVDNIRSTEKWKNLVNKNYLEYYNKDVFLNILPDLHDVKAIIHMGACSSTMQADFDYLYQNNFAYTKSLWNYCVERKISFIYASSAATYGDGANGFDDAQDITKLRPLNGYGYSKQLFDLWVLRQTAFPKQYVGLKFFNVYGPNEYFKGEMASVIFHSYQRVKKGEPIQLFRSYREDYQDGRQLRDFVYVKDICKVILWFLQHSSKSGLFNIGTGQARTFEDLANAVYRAIDMERNIVYIEMPEHLRKKYQYFTEAKMNQLYHIGYTEPFHSLEEGVRDYVQNYLEKGCCIY